MLVYITSSTDEDVSAESLYAPFVTSQSVDLYCGGIGTHAVFLPSTNAIFSTRSLHALFGSSESIWQGSRERVGANCEEERV